MRAKRWLVLVIGLEIVLLTSSIGVSTSSFVDVESSADNTFQAWTATEWVETTQVDFEAGVPSQVDTSSSPDDVKLSSTPTSLDPTTSAGSEQSESWHYASWSRRAPVNISNPGSGLTDYQVRVDVTYDADMQPDFDDIRFTDSDDLAELAHWRATYVDSTSATFWVKVPSIPSGNRAIYMYYGNAPASGASDGNATFVFFDDFTGASVDTDKWNVMHGSYVSVSGGNLELSGNNSVYTDGGIWTTVDFGTSYAVTMRARLVDRYPAFAWSVQNTNEGYIDWIADDSWGYLYKFTFGEPSSYVYLNTWGVSTYAFDTWSIIDIKINGTDYELYQDGSSRSSYSHSDLGSGGIGLEQWGNGSSQYDWIAVRKYAGSAPAYTSSGTIASQVLDTGVAGATWDELYWDETLQSNTDMTFEVRASDTSFLKDAATPSWNSVGGTSPVTSGLPSGRYIQWRATLTTSDTSKSATLHEVRGNYW